MPTNTIRKTKKGITYVEIKTKDTINCNNLNIKLYKVLGTSIKLKPGEILQRVDGHKQCFLKNKEKNVLDALIENIENATLYDMEEIIHLCNQFKGVVFKNGHNYIITIINNPEYLNTLLDQLYTRHQLNVLNGTNTIKEIVDYWAAIFNIVQSNYIKQGYDNKYYGGLWGNSDIPEEALNKKAFKEAKDNLKGQINTFVEFLFFVSGARVDFTTDSIQNKGCLDVTESPQLYAIILQQFNRLNNIEKGLNCRRYDPKTRNFKGKDPDKE